MTNRWKDRKHSLNTVFGASLALTTLAYSAGSRWPVADVDFDHDIRPIFTAHCSPCHTGQERAGGLSLNDFGALGKGGDSGALVVKGSPDKSLLLSRILGLGGKPRMPMGFRPLGDEDIAKIRDWIKQGGKESQSVQSKTHWSFLPPSRPAVPKLQSAWIKNPIDAFVLARLKKVNIEPSPAADRVTLLRRISLDLTGLPPNPSEVDAFLSDHLAAAYERAIDRLLASPHFGEKWALPWLDAARYADSNGFQQDGDTFQYVWRDWLVRALNVNMPFDRFTIEQLAGDLLPNPTQDQLIATAFNRNHMLNGEGGAIPEEQRNVNLFDRVDTTSTTWLGLTMTCARCHDHKYDPLSQRDYYSLMALFNNVPESGVPSGGGQYRIAEPWIYAYSLRERKTADDLERAEKLARESFDKLEASSSFIDAFRAWQMKASKEFKQSKDEGEKQIAAILEKPEEKRSQEEKDRVKAGFLDRGLESEMKVIYQSWVSASGELRKFREGLPRVMVMSDAKPRTTHILTRGNYEQPAEQVLPAAPKVFGGQAFKNRLEFAKWVVSPKNPLTARVEVNRIWQTLFGRGLVRTEENFGVKGEAPINPELLDWLAVDFQESGWNVKRLIKTIMMSSTYQQTSKVGAQLLKTDPENRLLARAPRFRLSSFFLRDSALSASGLLVGTIGGKPVYPYQPKGIWDGLQITEERDFTYPQSKGKDNYRRSLYSFWRRTVAPGNMFDASSRQVCTVKQSITVSPLHALTMLNDVTWIEAARSLAAQCIGLGNDEVRLREAFRRVCTRRPKPEELAVLKRSLTRARSGFSGPAEVEAFLSIGEFRANEKIDRKELAALTTVCLAIFNLDEAMTRE